MSIYKYLLPIVGIAFLLAVFRGHVVSERLSERDALIEQQKQELTKYQQKQDSLVLANQRLVALVAEAQNIQDELLKMKREQKEGTTKIIKELRYAVKDDECAGRRVPDVILREQSARANSATEPLRPGTNMQPK